MVFTGPVPGTTEPLRHTSTHRSTLERRNHVRSLVFTIAQNGYGFAYKRCIESQKQYADSIGAAFVSIAHPPRVSEAAQSAWLKIPVLLEALKSGYDSVAYIDSDCAVSADAPDFNTALTGLPDGRIYMAQGASKRINSGVIIAGGGTPAIPFLEQVMGSITAEIPEDDRRSLKFENGNVIYCARISGAVDELPTVWNNTYDPELRDFIRHYTGSLRAEYQRPFLSDAWYRLLRKTVYHQPPAPTSRDADFVERLRGLTEQVLTKYPLLTAP
jgi:hypothetical protein